MTPITLPSTTNYIGVFLTMRCNLNCFYCINKMDGGHGLRRELTAKEWADALLRIPSSPDLPITIQGGEPTLHPGFYDIMNSGIKNVDLLTNGMFDVDEFVGRTTADMFRKNLGPMGVPNAWFASIRISYHAVHNSGEYDARILETVETLKKCGYAVGVTCPQQPDPTFQSISARFAAECRKAGIMFQNKEFLGKFGGQLYGNYCTPDGVSGSRKRCECRTSELLVAPDGYIYRCHFDLYHPRAIAHILDDGLVIKDEWRECDEFGKCNPCDLKVKTDRHGTEGHSSVQVKNVEV